MKDKEIIKDWIIEIWQEIGHDLVQACNGDYDEAVGAFKADYASGRLYDELGLEMYKEISPILQEVLAKLNL